MEKPPLDSIIEIYHDQICEPCEAMRTDMDRDGLDELAASIKSNGLIEPIILRWHDGKLEIVAGHRRFKANGIAGFSKIKAVVREMTDDEMMTQRAHENLIRADVDPVDQAIYVGKLVGNDETKISSVAKMLGYSHQWVEDRLNILNYPEYFLLPLKENKVKLGVAKVLAQIDDDGYRKMFFDNAVRDGMTLWQAEYYLSQWKHGVLTPTEIISTTPSDNPRQSVPKFRVKCAKCGEMAEEPNVTSVFIHNDCPTPDTQPQQ